MISSVSEQSKFSNDESKATNILQPLKSSSCLYKQPSDRLDSIKQLYEKQLLHLMNYFGDSFIKVSRRNYKFLENSILIDLKGNIFEQYHWNDKKDDWKNKIDRKKMLVGEGSFKRLWDIKSLDDNSTQMVRARFLRHLCLDDIKCRLKKIKKLKDDVKNEVNSMYLLIPETIIYTNSFYRSERIVQMMPKASGGDLYQALKNNRLSYIGKLHVINSLGRALIVMHEKNWVHLDVKPHNTLLMNQDTDKPKIKLGDLDFIMNFTQNDKSYYKKGTPKYMDPKCLNNKAHGLEDAKIHDQFSFGVTSYEVLTGIDFRGNSDQEGLKKWVKEEDLKESSSFLKLSEGIQNIIRKCCLGSSEMRPYKLPEFLKVIEKLINEEVKNEIMRKSI